MPLSAPSIGDTRLSNKLIMLAAPELIVPNSSIVFGSWQTVSSSTLATANAVLAFIHYEMEINDNDGQGNVELFARKTGSGLSNDNTTERAHARVNGSGMGGSTDYATDNNTFFVELDSSQDFDYFAERISTPDVDTLNIVLVGYGT